MLYATFIPVPVLPVVIEGRKVTVAPYRTSNRICSYSFFLSIQRHANMEVASPFTSLRPSPGGGVLLSSSSSNNSNKRAACSSPSQLLLCPMEDGMITADHHHHHHHMAAAHASKRRRFHAPSEIDSLSAEFSSHTLFFNNKNNAPSSQQKSIFATNGGMSNIHRGDGLRVPYWNVIFSNYRFIFQFPLSL